MATSPTQLLLLLTTLVFFIIALPGHSSRLSSPAGDASTVIHPTATTTQRDVQAAIILSQSSTLTADKSLKASKSKGQALNDCISEVGDALAGIQKSVNGIKALSPVGNPNRGLQVNDLQTWMSGAETDLVTCTDGLKSVKSVIAPALKDTKHALALVNQLPK
ncbi:unnamed protein product [Cuscuta epithymum]|uniref:Pectinesterase inhibitor domain-containing protein n=1 Tax=Cuscuta epithymum TaxID=186058 RepID=A0AAV0DQ34_9ASTE|nr:unnamed protein product [Cuscuta epithymum]